jgi:hypothetical protein
MDVVEAEEVLDVLRGMKKKNNGPLQLKDVFKSVIGKGICDSSKSVSDCLRQLQRTGKIRTLNRGVNIELLEEVRAEYVQSSLLHSKR